MIMKVNKDALRKLRVEEGKSQVMAKWMANRIYQKHRFRITDEELVIETGLITTNVGI